MEDTGTIPGIGTIHIGGITVIIPTVPEEEVIARLSKDPHTGIRAIRIPEDVPDRKATITLAEIKAAVRPVTTGRLTTVPLSTRPLVRKVTTVALRAIRLLPARGHLPVPANNPAQDHLPAAGTEAVRPLRPTDSVRATKTYAEARHRPVEVRHLPTGEVRPRIHRPG